MDRDCCTTNHVNEETLARIRSQWPDEEDLFALAELFRALGDATRIRILAALAGRELCVCELMELLGMKQSSVSQHLRVLRERRLVRHRKEGRSVYYRMDDEHIEALYRTGLAHMEEDR